nr:uncharacterized protein LOC105848490 isoform X1 [Hydra vulgaris]
MKCFFDCLNVRNSSEGIMKRKPFLLPYTDVNDERLTWLQNTFLCYLEKWKECIINRPGNFSNNAKGRMFISWQTYEGLQITVMSVIELVKFLLKSGMPFVLTKKFNQDVLEEYFGRQRSLGRRNDNPTLYQFGYQSNTLRLQRSIAPVTGNTKGGHGQKREVSWSVVDNKKLPKRKKNL